MIVDIHSVGKCNETARENNSSLKHGTVFLAKFNGANFIQPFLKHVILEAIIRKYNIKAKFLQLFFNIRSPLNRKVIKQHN